jgi:catechol 2,3-dioxygenase-like lactoylglutathione lyase family enzyme
VLGEIAGVMIFTDDVSRLVSFYRDKLGLTVAEDNGKSVMFATPQPGGTQLAIESHSEVSGRSKEPDRIMINLRVEDCRKLYGELKNRGVEFAAEPYEDPDGAYVVATFRDPDGNTLQLVEFSG